jgi:hypothetical protein
MKTKEILSIFALVAIVLCLICGVVKMTIKSPKQKQSCDTACALLVFVAVVLVGISQLLGEIGGSSTPTPVVYRPGIGATCNYMPGSGLRGNCQTGLVCTDLEGHKTCQPQRGLRPFSYQCTKASGDYEYTCRMVNLPPNTRAGRYSTEAECKQACQSFSFKSSFSCEGGRCVLHQVAPDESKGYYATMARCQAKCKA